MSAVLPKVDTLSICEICKKKTLRVSLPICVRTTMIRWVVYLLRIFKMFHGLMNNSVLVLDEYWLEKTYSVENPVSLPLCLPQIPHGLAWDRTCTAAAAFLKTLTKLVMFPSQSPSQRTWMIRCGGYDQLDFVICGHDEDKDDDSDTWFCLNGGPIWPLSVTLLCLCGEQSPTLCRSLVCRRPVEGVASLILSERLSECDF